MAMIDPNRKVRWGVLGYANVAREWVMPAIQRADNSELWALASRDPAKIAECNKRYPGVRAVPDYEELLRDPEVDAIYIPLPNTLHKEWVIRAAERGKHILCEKPLCMNASECREMIAVCTRHGVRLMEAFMYRYTDRVRRVLEVVRSGALGEIKFIEATNLSLLTDRTSIRFKPELGSGSLYDSGCYQVNFAGLIADTIAGTTGIVQPASISAECVRDGTGGIDEIFSGVIRYPSGLIAAMNCGFNAHRRVFAEIVGTQGNLHVPDTFSGDPGALTLTLGGERREIPVAESDRFRLEIEDFADALLRGRPTLLGMPESLRNAEVIKRLFEAALKK
jgi:xylose dehydrogenase (NAD/NADP)